LSYAREARKFQISNDNFQGSTKFKTPNRPREGCLSLWDLRFPWDLFFGDLELPSSAVVGAGFEPAKALPPDLQSGPVGRLGIPPGSKRPNSKNQFARGCLFWDLVFGNWNLAKLAVGFEPTTSGLQNRDSAVELR
jgi:hypothetical protein